MLPIAGDSGVMARALVKRRFAAPYEIKQKARITEIKNAVLIFII
jgi:hypothetical protein